MAKIEEPKENNELEIFSKNSWVILCPLEVKSFWYLQIGLLQMVMRA